MKGPGANQVLSCCLERGVPIDKSPRRVDHLRNMKILSGILGTFLIALFVGCGSSGTSIDTAPVSSAFGGASADVKGQVSAIVSAVDSGKFKAALQPLSDVITKGNPTPEQRTALTTLLADMQRVVVENQEDYSMDVYNGLNDLVGTLAGNVPIKM